MSDLLRLSEISTALVGTPFEGEARRKYDNAYLAAHAFPARRLDSHFRDLKKMAKAAGVWESLRQTDAPTRR